jgi:LysM repeat protein
LQSLITNIQSGAVSGTTWSSLAYDANGAIASAVTTGLQAKTIAYVSDAGGQVVLRSQTAAGSAVSPRQFSFAFNGLRIGEIGNNGSDNTDYANTITANATPAGSGPFRGGAATGTGFADFDANYTAINTASGSEGADGSYVVRQGDTLAGIAQALWGDAALWYVLANANGITGEASSANALAPGRQLTIPAQVSNIHNSATTFKPYDPLRALGDIQPGAPQPAARKKGCGAFGAILSVFISLVVTWALPGVGSVLGKVIGKAIGGAIGGFIGTATGLAVKAGLVSAVSQGVNMAVGIQDRFSWKAVGLSATTAFAGEGLRWFGVFEKLGIVGSSFGARAVQGMVTSVVSQGIGVATGLQRKLDWPGVVGYGLGNAVGAALGDALHATALRAGGDLSAGNIAANLGSSMAGGIANAATRSLLGGTDFGDNIMAALPDVIAQTIGRLMASKVTGGGKHKSISKETAKSGSSATVSDGTQGSGNGSMGTDSADALPDDIVVTARRPSTDLSYLSFAGIGSRRIANDFVSPNSFAIPTYADGHLLRPADIQQVGMSGGVRPKPIPISESELQLLSKGDFDAFWESRFGRGDPVARTARQFGLPSSERDWSVNVADNILSSAIRGQMQGRYGTDHSIFIKQKYWQRDGEGGQELRISLFLTEKGMGMFRDEYRSVRLDLAKAHAYYVVNDTGRYGTRNFLSVDQVSQYHHNVFAKHDLAPTTFGGTFVSGSRVEAHIWSGLGLWGNGYDPY